MKKIIIAAVLVVALLSGVLYLVLSEGPTSGKSLIGKFYELKDFDIKTLFLKKSDESKSSVETLYDFKNADLKNASVLRMLIDTSNISDYIIDSFEVPEDSPARLNIKFKVDDRTEHRNNIDSASLNKMSVLLFALIPDMDELCFCFFDNWAEPSVLETAFHTQYYGRGDLTSREALSTFTADIIEKSIETEESFKVFYDNAMTIKADKTDNSAVDEKASFIGEDYEFVTNSSIGIHLQLNEGFYESVEKQMLEKIFKDIMFEDYRDQIIFVMRNDIRNFKTGETGYCAFIEYEGKVVSKKILKDDEAEFLAKLISN